MLKVYFYSAEIGQLTQGERGFLSFQYNELALDEPETSAISVRLPVRPQAYDDRSCRPFFENLLPESDIRDLLAVAQKYDSSDTILLLGAVGGECAGAVSVWPEGSSPEHPNRYEECSHEQIRSLFENTQTAKVVEVHLRTRQSLSGAQEKLVFRKEGPEYSIPLAGAPTNVILKRPKERFSGLVQNELVCMMLMEKAGLPIAESKVSIAWSGLFESLRYDRILMEDSNIIRLHQEDFCQVTGKGEAQKYQERGGPDLGMIRSMLDTHSSLAIEDVDYLLRWMIANMCLGNNDAHAKNLSILYTKEGIRLAPIYDAVCTVVYPFIDQTLSIYFGGRDRFEAVDATAFRKFARSLGFPKPIFPRTVAEEVIDAIVSSIDDVCHAVAELAGDHIILEDITNQVRQRSDRFRGVLGTLSE